ncbi:uncharacterized protein LOC110992817 [Pieris rapae]|uniref:uncharacterized protein LOC110992817 n=1 Tax=Pieris rapae TaxID=64459 RepID=UPI001E27BF7B|nr:uncharacterized protein LOC110992817 [Pieris rapae]
MKFLLICVLAACCHAQNSGESLLLRIEEHQSKLRNWENDNLRLLTTLTEQSKLYDNAIHNEAKLLEVVDYLVKKNMEVFQNVVSELNKIKTNMDKGVDGGQSLLDKETEMLEKELAHDEETVTHEDENLASHGEGAETLSDIELTNLEKEVAEEGEIAGHVEEPNVKSDDVDRNDNVESPKNNENPDYDGYNDVGGWYPYPEYRK